MENTKTITVGNWTVSTLELMDLTLEQVKSKFSYVDARRVETAFNLANPKQPVRTKKKGPQSE